MRLIKTLASPKRALVALCSVLLALPLLGPVKTAAQDIPVGVYGFARQAEAGPIPAQYDLVIVHYAAGRKNGHEVIEDIRRMSAQGRRVLVDFQFLTTRAQRRGGTNLPPVEQTASQLADLLVRLEGVELEGITLDEEHRTRPHRMAYLAELYRLIKPRFPERQFVQWLALGAKGTRKRWDVETFPADGYVIDPYLQDGETYRDIVESLSATGKPVYSVVWASPGWQVGAGRRNRAAPEWWNGSEWRIFYNRLAVNRAYGVDTLFFAYSLDDGRPEALAAGNECEREFARRLIETTIPHYRSSEIALETPDRRPDWIPGYCV